MMTRNNITVNTGYRHIIATLCRHEFLVLRLSIQRLLLPLGFFIMVMTLFPLAIEPSTENFIQLAPAIVIITALLATLLSLPQLFDDEYANGSLQQWQLSPFPLTLMVFVKIFVHWFSFGLILALASVVFAILLQLPAAVLDDIFFSVLLCTLCFTFIGAMGSALTLNASQASVLVHLLILPLTVPVLIFASSIIRLELQGIDNVGVFALLGAIALMSLTLAPFVCALVIRWQAH